jgi:hypothetical protein
MKKSTLMPCDFALAPIIYEPFPYVIKEEFVQPDLYVKLKASYPELPKSGGRTGYSLYSGDPDYAPFLNANAEWRQLIGTLMSQAFINYTNQQFKDLFVKHGCKIDPSQARYVAFTETRDHINNGIPKLGLAPEDLFVRVDIQQGKIGYSKKIHCDFKRRLVSCLIYFCDAQNIGIQGGGLGLYTADQSLQTTIMPKNNLAIIFPRFPHSFHAALPIIATEKPRDFLYIAISSTFDLWSA